MWVKCSICKYCRSCRRPIDQMKAVGSALWCLIWWIFSVLLPQCTKRVFIFRKQRRSVPQIAAALPHHRNWFLNVTVEGVVHMKHNELYRCFHLLCDEKKTDKFSLKHTNNPNSSNWSYGECFQSVQHTILQMLWLQEAFFKKNMYTSAPPHDRCKCFMVTGFIWKYETGT